MRDITLEDTIYVDFTTRATTGIPTVLAGTPVLSVLEENNATPITAGVSVAVDRASVVGLNMATIVAAAANGYESGKSYSVYISTGTVDSISVIGEIVGTFTIQASAAVTNIAALNDISVTDILTTQMTESYAADGAAPTLAQSLLLIQQQLGDFAISGTTITVKKVDGSTTAATFTLDSSTAPTSSTRAS